MKLYHFIIIVLFVFNSVSGNDWIDHFVKAEEAVLDKNYQNAVDEFTQAVELNPHEMPLYLHRGQIYLKLKEFEKAADDFTKIITTPNIHVSLLLPALRGRATAYLFIDGGDACFLPDRSRTDRFHLDFDRAESLDPNVSYYSSNASYEVFSQRGLETDNPEFRKAFIENNLKSRLCETANDIQFYPNGIVIVKLSANRSFCINDDNNTCSECGDKIREHLFDGELNMSNISDCTYWCERLRETSRSMCDGEFRTTRCREACRELVRRITRGCFECCRSGELVEVCVEPYQDFLEHVDCNE